MRRFWIDTDTASDDAVAILMALRWPDVVVEGISVVSGNVPVDMRPPGWRNGFQPIFLSPDHQHQLSAPRDQLVEL